MSVQAQPEIGLSETILPVLETRDSKAPAAASGLSLFARRLPREPLIQFLLAGALILTTTGFLNHLKAYRDQHHIVVSSAEIQQLQEVWAQQWGRPPDGKEMSNLIKEYIREEVLYREALASGLDKNDTIVRRRLVEKMEFLSQEGAASSEPSEADLDQFFQSNGQKYLSPAQASFLQIYFSASKRGASVEADAARVLAGLRVGNISVAQAMAQGDPFIAQSEYPLQTEDEIKDTFGNEFASHVIVQQPGAWEGPYKSSYGFHLVRVLQYAPARLPPLAEVRQQVTNDLKTHLLQKASDSYYNELAQRYRVDVENVVQPNASGANRP
ncbi:MAG TPA: peptidylprolyl isomerase [Candidatus Acidoferrum sp.]|nr:peptidylprolyl isomerase [Candidatus Acidoferrum sp.]